MKKCVQVAVLSITSAITFTFSNNAAAQVYKCTFADKDSRQNKVVYTDTLCGKTGKQTLTDIQVKSPLGEQNLQTAKLAQTNALDEVVTRAVLRRDFKLAKSLATSKEHWRLIAIAEGEAPVQPSVQAVPVLIVQNNDNACDEAKLDFESVSRTSWRDKELVATKRSMMYVACGVPEPVQQPIYVARYGGLSSERWVAPYYAAPHGGHRPHHYNNHHGNHHNHANAVRGLSLSYKSKHFGVNVGGFDRHSTSTRQQTFAVR
jgi:hypothetical protein